MPIRKQLNTLASADILILLTYFIVIIIAGLYYAHRKTDSPKDYYLAGKEVGWIAIGMSLFATNISSEHFVGLAGGGASRGLAVGYFEWLAIIFLIILAWFFAPILLKSRVFTVPEFLGRRFNKTTQLYVSSISIFTYLLTKISVSLFAGGFLLKAVLGWDMYTSAILMMIITGVYTIIGGMRTVVYTSVIQSVFLIVGATVLTVFGLQEVGGISALQAKLTVDHFSILKPLSDPDFPWTGLIFGAPILALWYWCTDQYIVQRILCARNLNEAQRGVLFTGLLKLLPMFILVLPGLIAAALFPGLRGDEAYPALLTASFLPVGIKGLALAGVFSALMSSLAASFISISTLFTMDIYRHWQRKATDKELVLIGRLVTIMTVLIGIFCVSLLRIVDTHIYIRLQSIQAYISPPVAAVFLLGIFWKRTNGRGAIWALLVGGVLGALRLLLDLIKPGFIDQSLVLDWFLNMNFLHFAILLFGISIIVMVTVSILSSAPYPEKIREYILSRTDFRSVFTGYNALPGTIVEDRLNRFFSVFLLAALISLWGWLF